MFLTSVFYFSNLILLFDLQTFIDDKDDRAESPLFLAPYQIIITLTSVGYGDFFPQSWMGRCVIMLCAIWGAVMISFIVLVVSNIFNLTEEQEAALTKLRQVNSASTVIQRSFRYYRLKEKVA